MSVPPNGDEVTTDSVIDAIALIEMQRQDMGRESDPEGWRNRAVAQLQEILRQIEEALRLHGPSPERLANAESLKAAINRVKARPGAPAQRPSDKGARPPRRPQGSRPPHRGRPGAGRRGGR